MHEKKAVCRGLTMIVFVPHLLCTFLERVSCCYDGIWAGCYYRRLRCAKLSRPRIGNHLEIRETGQTQGLSFLLEKGCRRRHMSGVLDTKKNANHQIRVDNRSRSSLSFSHS